MASTISIIGGGISGITTALSLQLLGFKTICYAEQLVEKNTPPDPRFASLYPAASVIPHSVHSSGLSALFKDSLAIFGNLFDDAFPALVKHRHYELYEFPVEEPAYTSFLENYTAVENIPHAELPHRKGIHQLYGWAFDCFVAECPRYIYQLYQLYEKSGGKIYRKKIERDEVANLSSTVIINCTGIWSKELFEDEHAPSLIRGHLLHLHGKKPITDAQGQICSYNYTPVPSTYATPQGRPCDVYFYPVGDRYVLGGSRQSGTFNNQRDWQGPEHQQSIEIAGLKIPRQIINLNSAILSETYGIKIDEADDYKAFLGYRYSRQNAVDGLRLEMAKAYGKKIIHNYGHGGAGVTLSWGCALQVARLLKSAYPSHQSSFKRPASSILKNLQSILKTSI